MSYAVLKMIHVASVILSYLLFTLRGVWMMQDSSTLQRRWVKIVPHVIDTVLLTSAIALAMTIQQNPLNDAWLGAKVAGLLLYIGLGMVALKRGKTRKVRITAWIAAHAVFFYIVLVALTKSPTLL
ncbi:MAG: SirB2 family protein [Nitrosospira sp.]|nr:SirB2 family protein [Nitrosospira sp.]